VPGSVRAQLETSYRREVRQFPDKYVPKVAGWLLGLTRTAGKWAGLIFELILVPLIAFYLLTDATRLREQALFFIPKRYRPTVVQYAGGMDAILRRYMHGQVILCAIAWVVVTLALLIMGIPGALLLGLLAGISRAIPVIGPVVGGIPVLAAVLLDPRLSGAFWWVLIGFTALHLFESKVLMPRILGGHLGVHPVLVILSLLVGYEMLGLLGMFLAPPMVAMILFILAIRRGEDATGTGTLEPATTTASD
jgi:predicted PurR-regulated permease PerM